MSPPPVLSTYRLQLRGDGFGFAEATALVDYLDRLGISHLYLSPILTARAGSTHGYDVVDPGTVAEALGGRRGFETLVRAARARGLGVIVDIVPNHVGVGDAAQNAWWWDVLRRGTASPYAGYFDLDPEPGGGRIALPVLGTADAVRDLTVDRSGDEPRLVYHDKTFPIAPGTDHGTAAQIHERQHYRLVPWDSGLVGYRRFFTVDDLAAVRVEDPQVFAAVHAQVASWVADDLVDGLRIDHPDGLADPSGYLRRVRDLLGPDRLLVIEKILADGEPLDPTLPVDGTTGYDALNELAAVFVDPRGEEALTAVSRQYTGGPGDAAWFRAQERRLRREVLDTGLAPEVGRLMRAIRRDAGDPAEPEAALREATVSVLAAVPVYRADYAPLSPLLPRVVGDVARAAPRLAPALAVVVRALAAGGEAATRFGQVGGAATAKAVEDRLFYRAARLVSLQEVGGAPGRFGITAEEFHLAWSERARRRPRTLTALSTHDTKRSEDVRARIGVLSQVPQRWARRLAVWESDTPCPDPAIGALLWQTLFGVWPDDGIASASLRARLHDYARKALRENDTRTSWTAVDEGFEAAVATWIDAVCDGPCGRDLAAFVTELRPHIAADALGQKTLQLLGPGIPDVYQGTEWYDDSLVDPDNRRPVDFALRRRMLAAAESDDHTVPDKRTVPDKLAVVACALRLRRERPASFAGGAYVPLHASGPAAGHVLGFGRGPRGADVDVAALVSRHTVSLAHTGWGATTVPLPPGTWVDRLTGREHTGWARAGEVFGASAVAILARA